MMVIAIVLSAIFGILYSMLYDCIPGKAIVKGLYAGLILWLVKDIASGLYLAFLDWEFSYAISTIFIGFFSWIAYGCVLGALYKN